MNALQRRQNIMKLLEGQEHPVSASSLAKQCGVSRQLIVGDIALLRAAGSQIEATPRGYVIYQRPVHAQDRIIAVMHKKEDLRDELETIVAQGGSVMDVVVEHPLYGELHGNLHICSLYDVDQFMKKCESTKAKPLSSLTEGIHLHTLRVPDEAVYQRILEALDKKGYLYHKEG